uniref:NADH-ubiquinone oxidoreductase chain 4L n=1 Tax=Jesogammarus hinumensis TaxID=378308 RepID=A0A891ZK59_9CRUS|nr:NADH dehydrogenase subunit 4L [Jesogammarus hinumensis]QRN71585.1 NADH dehydrogenase subunit 4L [Jesogammarus hinumensis]
MLSLSHISGLSMFLMGSLSVILNFNHFLNSLLSLELMALSVYLIASEILYLKGDEVFLLFFFVLIVCEGVVGLSLLIAGSYSHFTDYSKEFNSLVC